MKRVERTDIGGEIKIPDACLFCGDELRDGKCARNCEASRRSDSSRVVRMGDGE